MKIRQEHYKILLNGLRGILPRLQQGQPAYVEEGLTPKRFRWDALYATKLRVSSERNECELPLYDYMNDDHIDTALRTAMKELGLNWASEK